MKEEAIELKRLRQGYYKARRRARYWSGMPSFCHWKRSKQTRSSLRSENYELAMCDCRYWEGEIERITGKAVPHYDPRAEFAAKFTKILGKIGRKQKGDQ